jgi:hypothetical protein
MGLRGDDGGAGTSEGDEDGDDDLRVGLHDARRKPQHAAVTSALHLHSTNSARPATIYDFEDGGEETACEERAGAARGVAGEVSGAAVVTQQGNHNSVLRGRDACKGHPGLLASEAAAAMAARSISNGRDWEKQRRELIQALETSQANAEQQRCVALCCVALYQRNPTRCSNFGRRYVLACSIHPGY